MHSCTEQPPRPRRWPARLMTRLDKIHHSKRFRSPSCPMVCLANCAPTNQPGTPPTRTEPQISATKGGVRSCWRHRTTTTSTTTSPANGYGTFFRSCQILFMISFISSEFTRATWQALGVAAAHTGSQLFSPDTATPRFRSALAYYIHPQTDISNKITQPIGWPALSRRSKTAADEQNGKLISIQGQLIDLRRQLEAELSFGSRQVALGAPCTKSNDCQRDISNSHCNLDNFTCSCLPQHVAFNSTTCLAPALLGFECLVDAQCREKVPNSICLNGRCNCAASFVAYRKDKCLSPSRINDFCLTDSQCQLNDKHSYCRWKIPRVYGLCKCPPNYKLISGSNNDTLATRCAPRLGDSCLNDDECLMATSNSHCGQTHARAEGSSPQTSPMGGWPTSGASSLSCQCVKGFSVAPNKLECLQETPASSDTLASAKHHYEMIVIPSPAPPGVQTAAPDNQTPGRPVASEQPLQELDIQILHRPIGGATRVPPNGGQPSSTTAPGPAPAPDGQPVAPGSSLATRTSYANQTIEPAGFRMSSLGKPCASSRECQARDPHSGCVQGVCECLAPSARCRANTTGCHKDTFQCRNGQCISWYFVCDQFKNCDDGSDEDECRPGSCPPEAFQCHSDGACLTLGKLCDGRRDCADGSDELRCATVSAAPQLAPGEHAGRRPGPARCHPRAFTCNNGQCLPAYVFCNAVADCADGSDESEALCERTWARRKWTNNSTKPGAPAGAGRPGPASASVSALAVGGQKRPTVANSHSGTPAPPAPAGESPLVKTDRAAIERLLASLALASRTPEHRGRAPGVPKRSRLLQQAPDECPRDAFVCRNGKCRSSAILCSGVDGCGDNSDEDHCEVCQCEPVMVVAAGRH